MTDTDWGRVARYVRERRMQLGLKQKNTPAVSAATWSKIENEGAQSYKAFVIANIERTLGWPAGTIALIGAGGEPPAETNDLSGRLSALEERFTRIEQTIDRLSRRLDG